MKLFGLGASKPGEVSSCRDYHLEGLYDHDASDSKKPSSCRSDELKKIKDQLTCRVPSKLKVIPIVGMGGIGKTTLAKSIYEDAEILYHFHLCAWITISQEYKLKNVLLGLLRSLDTVPDQVSGKGNEELAELLYKSLKGRRFLIVLDDMWNAENWNDLKWIFPNDNNGSRIILTTRIMEVAEYAETDSPPHYMDCLSNEESWRLLHNVVLIGKPCPFDLVEIGREIARKCQGLPLAIVVVAGYLSKIGMDQNCWADVAKRLHSLITGSQEQILDILCLSYNYLPQHLKACFLYMGIFPRSFEIHVQSLIWLWSAVGFLHSEEEAEKCLEDLISRNLIMVRKKKFDGAAKTCFVHDLLLDLCFREARKEGHCIFSRSNFRHSDCDATADDVKYLMGLASTYLYLGRSFETDFPLTSIWFRQLRVLDIQSQYFSRFPANITDLVDLRYLALFTGGNIPASVSKLCNLETLINRHTQASPIFPKEIWLLQRLKHLHVATCTFLPNAADATFDGISVSSLPDLQTLSTISFASCTEHVFSRIPNIKELNIEEMGEEDEHLLVCPHNLSCLHQLEILNLYFGKGMRRQPQNLGQDTFPRSVKQLNLSGSHLPWEDMGILAMLPNLEALKLKNNAFKGPVYEQNIEGFARLKVLVFEDLDLRHWIAETIQFPVLQHLVLRTCFFLEEIPYCIGEVPTLESIELVACSSSTNESAKTIQQEQQSMGNYDLQVRIYRMIKKMVLKLDIPHDKTLRKAMMNKISLVSGVESFGVDMFHKKCMVFGICINAAEVALAVRKHCHANIVSVEPANVS